MKTFYAIRLNSKSTSFNGLTRWSLYTLSSKSGTLELVWPEKGITLQADAMPNCIRWNGSKRYPFFHFVVKGYGLNHLEELADNLAHHFREDVEINALGGWAPERHFMTYGKKQSE